jgi:hypothetical protein
MVLAAWYGTNLYPTCLGMMIWSFGSLFLIAQFFAGLVIGLEKTGSSIGRLIQCLDILKCTLQVQAHFPVEDRRLESSSRRHLLENQVRKLESIPGIKFLHISSSVSTTRGWIRTDSRISLSPVDILTSPGSVYLIRM